MADRPTRPTAKAASSEASAKGERSIRPVRPSAVRAAAAKFTQDKPRRLSIRVSRETLRSLRRKAVLSDKTVKRFVLDAIAAQGVEIADSDRVDDGDEAEEQA